MNNNVCLAQVPIHNVERKENINKKAFSKSLNRFIEIYTLIIGLAKKINSIAKATISMPRKIVEVFTEINSKVKYVLQSIEIKLGVVGGALTLMIFPIHLYRAGRNGIQFAANSMKEQLHVACEQGAYLVLSVVNLIDDATTLLSSLSALNLIRKMAWIEPLSLISGSVQTIGLVLCCLDIYRIYKCKKIFDKINRKEQTSTFDETVNYISDKNHARQIKLALGSDPNKLGDILRNPASKEKQKEMIHSLKQRLKHSLISIGVFTLIASIASVIAIALLIAVFAISILFPNLPFLAKTIQVMNVAAGTLFWVSSAIFLGKFAFDQTTNYQFKKSFGL